MLYLYFVQGNEYCNLQYLFVGWIDGPKSVQEGQTVHLKGKVHFCPFVRSLKWQKRINGEYIDINVHKRKYKGSTYDLKTPTLVIHDLDAEDEVEYRLEVVTKLWTAYSNEFSITLQRVSGELFYIYIRNNNNSRYM